MATQGDVLRALAEKEDAVKALDLVPEVKAGENTIRTWLNRLSKKGYVDGGGKEGWFITDEGRQALDVEKTVSVTREDVGADTESKLKYFAHLAGVSVEKAQGAVELILSRDPEDVDWCWEAMKQMDVPIDKRRVWHNQWRGYLHQPIPPSLKEEILGDREKKGDEKEEKGGGDGSRKSGRDYMIVDDEPVFVGEGLGEFSLQDAKEILTIKAIKAAKGRAPLTENTGPQGLSIDDIKTIIDMVQQGKGEQGGQKSYIVRPGEEGVVVEEIEAGKPLVIGGGSTPPKTLFINQEGQLEELQPGNPITISRSEPPKSYFVNPKGEVQELRPGEPIVVKQATQEPSKTYVVKPDGSTEEVAPGQPIIITQPPPTPEGDRIAVELDDSEGKSMGKIKLQLPDYIKYQKEFTGIRRDEEKHQQLLGIFGEIRKSIPLVAKNIDGIIAGIRGGGPGGAGPGSSGGGATVEIPCATCGRMNEVPRGAPTFPCIECNTVNEVTWN